MLSNANLPPALRRFVAVGDDPTGVPVASGAGPRIAFPPTGARVELGRDPAGVPRPLPLRAEGGRMPLVWLVNGVPVGQSSYRRQAEWQPDGAGAARITVIDGAGQSSSADIWLE